MKNQYVGDIGDFGKYSMLRAFIDAGVKVGVNWYLTENDGSNDGKFTDYLKKTQMERYNEEVFEALKGIAQRSDKSVSDIERSGILKDTVFYSEILKTEGNPLERITERNRWFDGSISALKDAELIFMDPDNGLSEANDPGKQGVEKYVIPDEVEQYFKAGKNVVYYCHKGRRPYDQWEAYKNVMFMRVKDAKPVVLTYHKGSQRSYVFLIHEEDFKRYRKIIDTFLRGWYKVFSEEYINGKNAANELEGDAFILTKADGTVVKIQKRADGWVQMESSRIPGVLKRMEVDMFCRYLGI